MRIFRAVLSLRSSRPTHAAPPMPLHPCLSTHAAHICPLPAARRLLFAVTNTLILFGKTRQQVRCCPPL